MSRGKRVGPKARCNACGKKLRVYAYHCLWCNGFLCLKCIKMKCPHGREIAGFPLDAKVASPPILELLDNIRKVGRR